MSTYGRPPCTVNNLDHVSRHTYRNNIYIPNPPIALTPIPLRHCTCVKRLLAVSQPQVWISYSQESSDSVGVKTDPLTGHVSTKIWASKTPCDTKRGIMTTTPIGDLIAIGEELPDHFETILTMKMSEKDLLCRWGSADWIQITSLPSDLNPTHEPASEGIRNWIPSFEFYVRNAPAKFLKPFIALTPLIRIF